MVFGAEALPSSQVTDKDAAGAYERKLQSRLQLLLVWDFSRLSDIQQ